MGYGPKKERIVAVIPFSEVVPEMSTPGFGDLRRVLSERRAKKQSDLDGVSDWSGLKRENWLRWRAFLASGTKTRTRPVKGTYLYP